MSQELEEKVAVRLYELWSNFPICTVSKPWAEIVVKLPGQAEFFRSLARAALAVVREAMADPSEEMLFAADWLENGTREAWKAMLSVSPLGEQ